MMLMNGKNRFNPLVPRVCLMLGLAVGVVAVAVVSCKPQGPQSVVRAEEPLTGIPPADNAELPRVLRALEGIMERQACTDCHTSDALADWALVTSDQFDQLRSTEIDPNTNQLVPDFMPRATNIHGLYKAYPEYFKRHFANKQNGEAMYASFERDLPPDPDMRFRDRGGVTAQADFEAMLQNLMRLAELQVTDTTSGCVTKISDPLKQHVNRMSSAGWASRLIERQVPMFACPRTSRDPLKCFSPSKWNDVSERFANRSSAGDVPGVPGTRVVVLADVGGTSYWSRSSPDGRYIGNAESGKGGHIDDLKTKTRIRLDRTLYDPGFFADNRGFTFHGGAAIFCDMKILDVDRSNLRQETIGGATWNVTSVNPRDDVRCHVNSSGFGGGGGDNVTTYQGVGAGDLPGTTNYIVTGSHTADPGSHRDGSWVNFAGQLKIFTIEKSSQGYDAPKLEKTVSLPGEGDYGLSPTSKYVVGRIAGRDDASGNNVQLGYRLRSVPNMLEENFDPDRDDSVSTICFKGSGSKPMFSLDERFITFHQYEPSGTANIYVSDLANGGKTYRVTNYPRELRALFPHFRADGWIYYQVQSGSSFQSTGTMVATDVAVRLANGAN